MCLNSLSSRSKVSNGCLPFRSSHVSVYGEVQWARLHFHGVWCLGELLSLVFSSIIIQGAWTEQRFPLLSYEASGSWSYRLACEAATISVVGCRSGGYL